MRGIAGAIVLMFLAAGVGATQGNNDSVVLVPVLAGVLMSPAEDESPSPRLPPGSTWYVAGGIVHSTKCVSDEDCVFRVHQEAALDFNPVR